MRERCLMPCRVACDPGFIRCVDSSSQIAAADFTRRKR